MCFRSHLDIFWFPFSFHLGRGIPPDCPTPARHFALVYENPSPLFHPILDPPLLRYSLISLYCCAGKKLSPGFLENKSLPLSGEKSPPLPGEKKVSPCLVGNKSRPWGKNHIPPHISTGRSLTFHGTRWQYDIRVLSGGSPRWGDALTFQGADLQYTMTIRLSSRLMSPRGS